MVLQLVNVLYVLLAIAMVALILMQRGAGAQAGSGFGGGASSTVFGARGASNFLSKTTKWLAVLFFAISMGMAVYASRVGRAGPADTAADLGVMAQVPAAPAQGAPMPATPGVPVATPQPAPPAPAATPPTTQTPTAMPPPVAPAPQGD